MAMPIIFSRFFPLECSAFDLFFLSVGFGIGCFYCLVIGFLGHQTFVISQFKGFQLRIPLRVDTLLLQLQFPL